jgi:AcrR family transcriptional regulator
MASRKKKTSARAGGEEFANDAERSKADILAVATEEFANHGLSGARVDAIAERTRTSKRMIYYYFKGKEGLYRAVLEKAYSEIRSLDTQEGIEECSARRSHSQDYRNHFRLRRNPSAFHQPGGRGERASRPEYCQAIIDQAPQRRRHPRPRLDPEARLTRGVFRSDVSALDVHLFISAFCVFRVSNRFTFGTIFDCDLSDAEIRTRHKKMLVEAVLRYLEPVRGS